MDKNAYEIRLEVLRMAHDDCFTLFSEKLQSLRYSKPAVPGTGITELVPVTQEEILKLYPNTDIIVERAKDFYKFICEK